MKLEIRDTSGLLKPEFGKWLCKRALYLITKDLDDKKLIRFDNFFNSTNNVLFPLIGNKTIVSTRQLILFGCTNFICSGNPLTLEINPLIQAPNFDRVKLATICKFINYGNTQIQGYPIFTDIFENMANNIVTLVDEYYSTLPHIYD